MLVLLTGGAGFVGSHVAEALRTAGHEVRVLDCLLPAAHRGVPDLPSGTEFRRCDLRDPEATAEALVGVDAVCHQAAMVGLGVGLDDAPDYVAANVLATAVLLRAMAAAGVRRLVLASSMVVYGEGRYRCASHGPVAAAPRRPTDLDLGHFEPPCPACGLPLEPQLVTEDAAPDPRNVYATTKLAQEHLCAAAARVSGTRVAALRYHNVYGPRMPRDTPYAGVASIFRSALAAGQAPQVFEDGGQRRDFVHVRDVASANVAALTATAPDGPLAAGSLRAYNVGSGTPRTVGELAAALSTACGGPPPVVTGAWRPGDVRHVTACSQRLRDELGWKPLEEFAAGVAEFASAPQRD